MWTRNKLICPQCLSEHAVVNWGGGWFQFYDHKNDDKWCSFSREYVHIRMEN